MIVVITGPAGAGKSTAADLLASSLATKTCRLSTDDMRNFVRAGYADPSSGWTDDVVEQVDLARCVALDAARLYVKNGYTVIVDDVVAPGVPLLSPDHWIADGFVTRFVVLMPKWDRVWERNQTRVGQRLLSHQHLRAVFEMMQPWRSCRLNQMLVDNSDTTPETTVDRVIDELGLARR